MQRRMLVLTAGGILLFCLAYFAINTDVGSDPKLTLVTSQVLIETGSPFLDPYIGEVILDLPFDYYLAAGEMVKVSDRYINYYPLGPSLISMPFVAVGHALGKDMLTTENYQMQRRIAAVTVVLIYLLAFALASAYLDFWASFAVAMVSVLGSSLISTMGTALWSHNYAVLCTGGALLLIVRETQGKSARLYSGLIGLLLFLAFLNRPSSVAFIVPAFAYLLWYRRRAFVVAAATSSLLFAVYMAWNMSTLGAPLPEYFSTDRLQIERAPMWVGVAGNLISPSRGLLIFSPFLIPVIAGYVIYWRKLLAQPIVLLCLAWCILQLLIIARAASWWGGWSFGPRLLTDIWPGLIVLTSILWAFLRENGKVGAERVFAISFLALGCVAAVVHVGQGLNSQAASRWNSFITPVPPSNVTPSLGDLFNWRYAQPLATNAMLCRIERDAVEQFPETMLPVQISTLGQTLAVGDSLTRFELPREGVMENWPATGSAAATIMGPDVARTLVPYVATPGGYSALFLGWSSLSTYDTTLEVRWSVCRDSEVWLRLDPGLASNYTGSEIAMEMEGKSNGPQDVVIAVNGQTAGIMHWTNEIETQEIRLPATRLLNGGLTRLTFSFPDAHTPNIRDQRPLGLAIGSITLSDPNMPSPPSPAPVVPQKAYPSP